MLCLFFSFIPVLKAENITVSLQEQNQWLRHLLPLPHEISIKEKITLNPRDVSVTVKTGAGDLEKNAANELAQLFKEKTGAVPSGTKAVTHTLCPSPAGTCTSTVRVMGRIIFARGPGIR